MIGGELIVVRSGSDGSLAVSAELAVFGGVVVLGESFECVGCAEVVGVVGAGRVLAGEDGGTGGGADRAGGVGVGDCLLYTSDAADE